MFGYGVGFSGTADLMALFSIRTNTRWQRLPSWIIWNGHISAMPTYIAHIIFAIAQLSCITLTHIHIYIVLQYPCLHSLSGTGKYSYQNTVLAKIQGIKNTRNPYEQSNLPLDSGILANMLRNCLLQSIKVISKHSICITYKQCLYSKWWNFIFGTHNTSKSILIMKIIFDSPHRIFYQLTIVTITDSGHLRVSWLF